MKRRKRKIPDEEARQTLLWFALTMEASRAQGAGLLEAIKTLEKLGISHPEIDRRLRMQKKEFERIQDKLSQAFDLVRRLVEEGRIAPGEYVFPLLEGKKVLVLPTGDADVEPLPGGL